MESSATATPAAPNGTTTTALSGKREGALGTGGSIDKCDVASIVLTTGPAPDRVRSHRRRKNMRQAVMPSMLPQSGDGGGCLSPAWPRYGARVQGYSELHEQLYMGQSHWCQAQ